MKKTFRILFLTLLVALCLCSFASASSGSCGDDLTWTMEDGVLTVAGEGAMYDWEDLPAWEEEMHLITSVVVEEGVTSIGKFAFADCMEVQSVSLPESLLLIGEGAFVGCENLVEIHLPGKLEVICQEAFSGCGFETLTIPASVTTIEPGAFVLGVYDSFAVESGSQSYKAVDGVLLSADGKVLVSCPWGREDKYTAPAGVETVEDSAFSCCHNLRDVRFHEGLLKIGESAFYRCGNLCELGLPRSLVSVGEGAFYSCERLAVVHYSGTELEWEDIPLSEGNNALWFDSDHYYEQDYIDGGGAVEEDEGIAGGCGDALTWRIDAESGELTISGSGEMWNWNANAGTYSPWRQYDDEIRTVILEEGVTSIGDFAFLLLGKLERVTLPESLVRIGKEAFRDTAALKELTIPAAVAEIGARAFEASVSEGFAVAAGNTAYKAVEGVLFTADGKTLISFPWAKTGLYHVPAGTEYIGEAAFLGASVTGVAMYDGLSGIESDAFANSAIQELILPVTLAYIEGYAFYRCDLLHTVYYDGSEDQWDSITMLMGNDSILDADLDCRVKDEESEEGSEWEVSGLCGAEGDNLTWTLNRATGTLVISGTGEMADWDSDHGIDPPWKQWDHEITGLVVEEGVATIGDFAFKDCAIRKTALPESLTAIGVKAFADLPEQEEFCIPAAVETIGDRAFRSTTIHEFTVAEESQHFKVEDNVLFTADGRELLWFPSYRVGNYAVPDGVETIRSGAFYGSQLVGVTLPKGTKTIGEYAFSLANVLMYANIPNTVESMGAQAFEGCNNFRSVTYVGSRSEWEAFAAAEGEKTPNFFDAEISFLVTVTVRVPVGTQVLFDGQFVDNDNGTVTVEEVCSGTYDLRVMKKGCLSRWIKHIPVVDEHLDLGTVPALLAGDVNGDDMINIMDMGAFRQNFGKMGEALTNVHTDVNGDGMVNIMDMGTFRMNFGKTAAKDCTVEYTA